MRGLWLLGVSLLAIATQDTARAVARWVHDHATPLVMDDLAPLGAMIGDAPLVGLGEGTHGTHEFYVFKANAIKYLVREKNFRTIAFEGNFAAVMALDDYIVNGRGTPESALTALDGFNWDTEELIQLLQWLRAYNMDATHAQKVRFFGIDVLNIYPSLEAALGFIAARDTAAATRLRRPFVSLLHLDLTDSAGSQRRSDDLFERLAPGEPQILIVATEAVVAYLDSHRPPGADTAAVSAWVIARQHGAVALERARIMRTIEGWFSSLGPARSDSLYQAASSDATALRDFLDHHDAALADTVRPLLTALASPQTARTRYVYEMTEPQRMAWDAVAEDVIARITVDRDTDPEWDAALRDAETMRTLLRDFREYIGKPPLVEYEPRDPSLAQNVAWVVDHAGPRGKVIVWAHDEHVGAFPYAPGLETLGGLLRKRYGARYVAIGTLFDRGGFQARIVPAPADTTAARVRGFTVGPAEPGSIEATLAAAARPAFLLDLRHLPPHTLVSTWFEANHRARYIGNSFDASHESRFYQTVRLSEMFDIIAFFDRTTRAQPTSDAVGRFRIGT